MTFSLYNYINKFWVVGGNIPFRNDGIYSFSYRELMVDRVSSNQAISAPMRKLFQAIDNENIEDFKQALAEGADVNAFDEEGVTPLISIARACDVAYGRRPILEQMAQLLLQNSSIDINVQSREHVYEERKKKDQIGRLIYLSCGREVAQVQPGYYVYCDNGQRVGNEDSMCLNPSYGSVMESIKTSKMKKDTALHIACQLGAKDIVKILLTHPGMEISIRNCEYKSPVNCIARGFEEIIKLEFKKAQRGKQLLNALSNRDISQAKRLLNEELNSNCWKRTPNGEIETPLGLIIELCLGEITEDKKEVLTKLLKHKDVDFSQVKSTSVIERNIQLKQIIEQAITEQLIDTINKKDLDNVKKLVEDNCFMSRAIVTAVLRVANNPTEPITNYLNEKFPAKEDFKRVFKSFEEAVTELERVQAQLEEKKQEVASKDSKILQLERDLEQVKQGKVDQQARLTDENAQLRIQNQNLNNKNKRSLGVRAQNGSQDNYASISFILSGAFAIGACLTIPYLAICTTLAVVAQGLFLIGCYFVCKKNGRDMEPSSTTYNPRVTRASASSLSSVENFYTY